jgi:hypothetical protein
MGNQDGDIGLRHAVPTCGMRGYHRPRSKEDTHPDRISPVRNVATRWGPTMVGQSQERRNPQRAQDGPRSERRRAERQRESITGRIERYSTRKGADVDRVSHPMMAARTAKRGTS